MLHKTRGTKKARFLRLYVYDYIFDYTFSNTLNPKNKNTRKPSEIKTSEHLYVHYRAGDERIELPPKVLETPIIPLDQSPLSFTVLDIYSTFPLHLSSDFWY